MKIDRKLILSYPFTIRPLTEEEGRGYIIEYPDLPGCMSDGETPEEAIRNGADAVKAYLAAHLCERLTLDEIARAVAVSPFHLARIFQQHAGVPVHRYLTQLRLRAALEQLAGGAHDLTALALELGFSSHSHFTDAFRREFGCPPSAARADAALRELSKNLEV